MKKPIDPLAKLKEEEREEKRRKVHQLEFDRSDYLAMFLAAMKIFLPPILLLLFVLWLFLYFFFL